MIALLLAVVLGYSSPGSYAQPVTPDGGGGGRWFTGSPADAFDCSVCHAGGDSLALDIVGLPIDGWSPGQTYELQISWGGERANVALLAEFARMDGSRFGEAELVPEESLVAEERCSSGTRAARLHELEPDRQIVSLDDCGAELLRVQWTAPERVDEDAWLFVAGVHADASEDPSGDGVMVERIQLSGPASSGTHDGCALVEETPRSFVVLALLGVLGLALVHLRRGRAALIMVLLFASGCARVQPHQRGRLAGPDMQMELDPELCGGRTHAVEYREGAAGGLGGGGGGCGCN